MRSQKEKGKEKGRQCVDKGDLAQAQEESLRNAAIAAARAGQSYDFSHPVKGLYVACIDCGAKIPDERLAIVPIPKRCCPCQKKFELLRKANRYR